jgi:hypothetical protein
MSACSTNSTHSPERSLANTRVLQSFIKNLARKSGNVATRELEQQIQNNLKKFIMQTPDGSDVGNWARMGITKEQAQ